MGSKRLVIAIVAVASVMVLAGCTPFAAASRLPASRSHDSGPARGRKIPRGPRAVLSGPITGGKGVDLLSSAIDLAATKYTQNEYFASGTASSFTSVGAQGTDGRWEVAPKDQATYRTRIIVRRPSDPKLFNGTVLVEWLNVSAGADTAPDFTYAGPEITRSGYAWVGVSVQKVGVSGGTGIVQVGTPTGGLVGDDPVRYGSLHHPGDQYALDMYTQIGRALRKPGHGSLDALGGLHPKQMIAVGESQSAFQLTTYIDAIQPTTHLFDGFFVHSRGGGAVPIGGGSTSSSLTGGIRIRTDNDVPVLLFETETDEAGLHYFVARQPDNRHLRLWDVAGASHADSWVLGGNAGLLPCGGLINTAPTHFVVSAALAQLNRWVRTGDAPPAAPRMDVALVNGAPVVQRDARGNAIGGVRTAANDVPVAALSGVPFPGSSVLCSLFGSTKPFDAATLTQLYKNQATYDAKFARATSRTIARGYELQADRTAIIAEGKAKI